MDERMIVLVLVLCVTLYPIWLIWRFLTLGIKVFKKYIREHPDYTSDLK